MNAAPPGPAWRFTVGTLMKWVAVVAVALGVLRMLLGIEGDLVAALVVTLSGPLAKIALFGLMVALPFFLVDRLILRPRAARYDRRLRELNQGFDPWKDGET